LHWRTQKNAVVTAARGNRQKVAKRLIEDGFRVVLVDRNGESAKAAAESSAAIMRSSTSPP
jgi:NAD(P)-dependent dehydrogenase (short-subunit alcohol dehydrogenase family)